MHCICVTSIAVDFFSDWVMFMLSISKNTLKTTSRVQGIVEFHTFLCLFFTWICMEQYGFYLVLVCDMCGFF